MNLNYLVIAVFLVCSHSLAFADGVFNGDWLFNKGAAQQQQSSVSQQDTTFAGSAAQLHLLQTGSAVSGTWSETTHEKVQSGSLTGVIEGDTLRIHFCSDDGASNEPYVCPNYPTEFDYLVMHQTYLAWYRYSPSGFDRYLTLQRRTNETLSGQAADSKPTQ
jgi:hypothetical protein